MKNKGLYKKLNINHNKSGETICFAAFTISRQVDFRVKQLVDRVVALIVTRQDIINWPYGVMEFGLLCLRLSSSNTILLYFSAVRG